MKKDATKYIGRNYLNVDENLIIISIGITREGISWCLCISIIFHFVLTRFGCFCLIWSIDCVVMDVELFVASLIWKPFLSFVLFSMTLYSKKKKVSWNMIIYQNTCFVYNIINSGGMIMLLFCSYTFYDYFLSSKLLLLPEIWNLYVYDMNCCHYLPLCRSLTSNGLNG